MRENKSVKVLTIDRDGVKWRKPNLFFSNQQNDVVLFKWEKKSQPAGLIDPSQKAQI